eukprot:6172651-Pleurochrysis_carterae.AAC.7
MSARPEPRARAAVAWSAVRRRRPGRAASRTRAPRRPRRRRCRPGPPRVAAQTDDPAPRCRHPRPRPPGSGAEAGQAPHAAAPTRSCRLRKHTRNRHDVTKVKDGHVSAGRDATSSVVTTIQGI